MYEGFYKDNLQNGMGFELKDSILYIGQFSNDVSLSLSDKAILLYPNSDVYVGEVRNGRKDGKGIYFKIKQN